MSENTAEELHQQNICVCCLSQNVRFINTSTCKHLSFFYFFYKFKFEYHNVICYQCHNILRKIESFKIQVEESFKILSDQAQRIEPPKTFQNLQISKVKLLTAFNEPEYEDPKLEPATTSITHEDHYDTDFVTDVKIEHESSDFEADVPLSEIKKEIKSKKVGKKKKKKVKEAKKARKDDVLTIEKKKSSLNEKYEGKIAIVTLNREEMMLEREADAKKEAYLNLPYKCENCITGFDHELTLEEHIKKRHGEKKGGFECDICKSVLSTLTSYKEHMRRHTRRYECLGCGKRNHNVYSLAKHYNDKHGRIDLQFTCHECGFTTESHRSYRYHRDKHKQKQQCAVCGSTFVNSAGLRVHMFTVHKQSMRIYSCASCGKVYNAKSGLAAHAATAHRPPARAYCALCKQHFNTQRSLAHHLKTHSRHLAPEDKKFACTECDAKFLTKASLQEHIDFVHLKSNKYECEKCNRVFKNGSALKKHDNFVHKKLRPPRNKICDHCGRGFTTLSILRSHVRTHTGERPLACARCPATFAHSAALYTHSKLLHARAERP